MAAMYSSSVRLLPSAASQRFTDARSIFVLTKPGLMALQVTPCGAPSSATQRVRPRMPDLEAQ